MSVAVANNESADGSAPDHPSIVASRVATAIFELEAALREGSLDARICRSDVKGIIGESLVECYTAIAARKLRHDRVFRQNWVAVLVEAFRVSLQPPEKYFLSEAGPVAGLTRKVLVHHHQGSVIIREDQAFSVRRWGIGFKFEDQALAKGFSDRLIGVAQSRLASNISSLRNLEATYLVGYSNLSTTAKYDYDGIGKRFEHLVFNILNEFERPARWAPIAEDLLEKTDLRISFPSLHRRGGARIQVSLATEAERHHRKIGALYLRDEFICLTPMDLARSAVAPPEGPLFDNFEWMDFWTSLGGECHDENELARMLRDLFVDALSFPRLHPLGPLWILPPPLRQFIRVFAEYWATETTNCIRAREQTKGQFRGSARKFVTGKWLRRLVDPSPGGLMAPHPPSTPSAIPPSPHQGPLSDGADVIQSEGKI